MNNSVCKYSLLCMTLELVLGVYFNEVEILFCNLEFQYRTETKVTFAVWKSSDPISLGHFRGPTSPGDVSHSEHGSGYICGTSVWS